MGTKPLNPQTPKPPKPCLEPVGKNKLTPPNPKNLGACKQEGVWAQSPSTPKSLNPSTPQTLKTPEPEGRRGLGQNSCQ